MDNLDFSHRFMYARRRVPTHYAIVRGNIAQSIGDDGFAWIPEEFEDGLVRYMLAHEGFEGWMDRQIDRA